MSSCSEQFLEAAWQLSAASSDVAPPRMQLQATALEYRLKAYICAVREGAPGTRDLGRLATLAVHCGLTLTEAQRADVVLLDRAHSGAFDSDDVPFERVRELCGAIASQCVSRPR